MSTTQTLPDAVSESQALRQLDLPTTRRDWLRHQLPSAPIGGQLVYSRAAVENLKHRMDTARDTRQVAGTSLHHR
jgi:hypothetical protein